MTDPQNCREEIETQEIPEAEFARILGTSLVLSVVAGGKSHLVRLNRRRLLGLVESGFEALKELEPGW